MCPGVLFALQVLGLTLARLIQQFVLKKPSDEPVDMTESMGATNGKATPLDVLFGPRLPTDMYKVAIFHSGHHHYRQLLLSLASTTTITVAAPLPSAVAVIGINYHHHCCSTEDYHH
uniref:Cytochrome P450 n=1 Tax=Lactuca sativa TaxID=4236 RepID=A0A9R1VMI6_LACSA|nr:hypothetical protein LSAT_V11C400204570 [Lactuca sativa]